MNVGLATNPHDIDPRLEQLSDWLHAATGALEEQDGVLIAWGSDESDEYGEVTVTFRLEHGCNALDTKHNLARRLEELAAGLRES